MTIQAYCIIENNVVTNVVMWDGDVNTWAPPAGSVWVVQATTPSQNWVWDSSVRDWVLVEIVGGGSVGFTWDGTMLTTNEPKPAAAQIAPDQPAVTGAQTL